MGALETLVDIIGRHTTTDGIHSTPISGLRLARSNTPTMPMPVVYEPTLCLIAQGRKQVATGNTSYDYDAMKYLVASVDIPVMGTVVQASEAAPYLSLMLDLDMNALSDLDLQHPAATEMGATSGAAIELNDTTPELLDAAVRLARLLDKPGDIEALAPLIIREILYRLLTGLGNGIVRQMARADSRLRQIAKAISWLRSHYREPCRIDHIAELAGMSRSTFHAHFKAVTSMTVLEFRSQLRLQEARRLMVADALDAADAGYRVGYESPSQFSRDYARLFGTTPAKDAGRLRATAGV